MSPPGIRQFGALPDASQQTAAGTHRGSFVRAPAADAYHGTAHGRPVMIAERAGPRSPWPGRLGPYLGGVMPGVRERLTTGQAPLAAFVNLIPSAVVTQALAAAGADVVLID